MRKSDSSFSLFCLKTFSLILCLTQISFAQTNCISVIPSVCIGACQSVTYIGGGSTSASYSWSISCGTITNPNQQNPHVACFNTAGLCTIQVIWQEPGQGPDTCTVQVEVFPLPTSSINLVKDTVCAGDCTMLEATFTGIAPFSFEIIANNVTTVYNSNTNNFSLPVCPSISTIYNLINLSDLNCTNTGQISKDTLTVIPQINGSVTTIHNELCASPGNLNYKWYQCNNTIILSTDSCYSPVLDGCYCVEMDNGICKDTVCQNFRCNLTCSFDVPDTICIGDTTLIYYTGNGGQKTKFDWILNIDNLVGIHFRDQDSLKIVYNLPGCYPIQLMVEEAGCISICFDTICVISKDCACSTYTKNQIIPTSSVSSNCCYDVTGDIASFKCFNKIQVKLSSGGFSNVKANTSLGWSVTQIAFQLIEFTHNSGFLPPGNFNAGSFCVDGSSNYTVTVHYLYASPRIIDTCTFNYVFSCNQPPYIKKCDSSFVTYLEFQHALTTSCCVNIHMNNPIPNCFTKVQVLLSSGTFGNIQPDTANGFVLIPGSGIQEFSLRHLSGFLPPGQSIPASFCISAANNPVQIKILYFYSTPSGQDTCIFNFIFDCPGGHPAPTCCDSLTADLLPIGPPGTCCFDFFANSKLPNCFSQICFKTSSGNFNNINAHSGWNAIVNISGFCFSPTSIFTPSGSINPGSFCVNAATSPYMITVEFLDANGKKLDSCQKIFIRDCPGPVCKCDSLKSNVVPFSTQPGSCCYNIQGNVPTGNCFTNIRVLLSSGNFSGVLANSGFNVVINNSKDFNLFTNTGFIPSGSITPASFCVTGSSNYTITVHYLFSNNGITDTCTYHYNFDCPPAPPVCKCDSLKSFVIPKSAVAGKCCYNVTGNIPSGNCYTKIEVLLSSGSFSNIVANAGFTSTINNSQSFNLIPTGGFIPSGFITPASFCITGSTFYSITLLYYFSNTGIPDTCIFKYSFDCLPPPPLCNCDSLDNNVLQTSAMPGLCCYKIEGNIPTVNCFSQIQVLLSSGNFTNVLANPGYNIVANSSQSFNINPNSGFIPGGFINPANFCVTGSNFYMISIIYYYNNNGIIDTCSFKYTFDCPSVQPNCTCDSLKNIVSQSSVQAGLCCYDIQGNIPTPNCFNKIQLHLSSGSFTNIQVNPGFILANNNPQNFTLNPVNSYIQPGFIHPAKFCVTGSSFYTITVYYFHSNSGIIDTCTFSYTFDCPSVKDSLCNQSICPSGNRAWQTVGFGLTQVYDMTVYQCKLIVAGQFLQAGNTIVNNIAAWDGSNWTPLNQGVNGPVRCLAVHNGLLYVGGQFTTAGTLSNVNNIAAWNGQTNSWSHLDNGVTGIGSVFVASLLSTSNGLVVGGSFQTAGQTANLSTKNIAQWNGTAWNNSNFNSTFNGPIYTLRQYNNQLYAGGTFSIPHLNITSWNGTSWTNLSGGINLVNNVPFNGVNSEYVFNNDFYVGGHFLNADNVSMTQHIARWNGVSWQALPGGDFQNSAEAVNDLFQYNNKMYAGGEFTMVGNQLIKGVAEWDGANWFNTNQPFKVVRALEAYDSCGTLSCDLYAGGEGFVNKWVCLTSNTDLNQNNIFYLQPNPANEELQVVFESLNFEKGLLKIYNLQGDCFSSIEVGSQKSILLNVSSFLSGIYIVEFLNDKHGPTKQMFVKN